MCIRDRPPPSPPPPSPPPLPPPPSPPPSPPPPSPPPPSFPLGCTAGATTGSLPVSVRNQYASWNQIVFAQQGSITEQTIGDGYTSTGTKYTETFKGLFAPVASGALEGTLNGYMDSWRWRKCATGCSDYVSQKQSTQPLFDPDISTLQAYLRIPTVYVDKTRFYAVFKITDAFGSPRFASSAISVTLAANIAQYASSLSCQTGGTLGGAHSATTQWLYYCSGDAATSEFSSATSYDTTLELTASFNGVNNEMNVGGSDVALNKLTLARTPDWWHATLRNNQD
eukprot:4001714-Prymnesium_polylepis.1